MLETLSIQNLALIESLELNFKTGFTALTGETGAGKSILLDALGLTLGDRADSSLVRHGTKRADVTAHFDIKGLSNVSEWLEQQELDDEGQCLLRRTLTSEGRSKAYINGLPASVNQLKDLGSLLIDIHGQHEHQSLLKGHKQLALLDAYAQHPGLLETTRKNYQAWQKLNHQYQTLLENQTDRQSKIELLEFQLQEFDKVMPTEGEFETLSDEQNILSHANEIKQAAYNAHQYLEGDGGVTEKLTSAIAEIEKVAEYNADLAQALEQLNSLLIDTQEVANDIHAQDRHIELDHQRLNAVEDRLTELFALAKKYQLEPEELLSKQQTMREELQSLNGSAESLEQLKTEISQAWDIFTDSAHKLSASRKKAATKLSKTVTASMQELGMKDGQFDAQLTQTDKASTLGFDEVTLMVTANKGQPLQPLSKVASGGELSRISLAIQVASAEVASLPTLIFDEVDVGIGGGIADVVGQKMQLLGQHRQILSITHLAQVASHGNQHLNIIKSTQAETTTTQVVELNEKERIEELARMLGGQKITEQTLKHAEEMLANNQQSE